MNQSDKFNTPQGFDRTRRSVCFGLMLLLFSWLFLAWQNGTNVQAQPPETSPKTEAAAAGSQTTQSANTKPAQERKAEEKKSEEAKSEQANTAKPVSSGADSPQQDSESQAEPDATKSSTAPPELSADEYWRKVTWPLIVLGIGIVVVLGLIIGLKVNAFIALITAAIVVSLCAEGNMNEKVSRVASAFGGAAGGIGIVIGLAAVIGQCMLDSGAADRIVRTFVRLLGEKRSPLALMGSGFVLAVPVFFDTVFYLLVPLARSLYRRTNKNYLMYILAIAAGGAITHSLVPPTPGPLLMAANLGIDVGMMIMMGTIVAIPAAFAGLLCAVIAERIMPIPMRETAAEEPEPLDEKQLPSLFVSLLPVLLPVILISANTVMTTLADKERAGQLQQEDVNWDAFSAAVTADEKNEGASPGKRLLSLLPTEVADIIRSGSQASEEDQQEVIKALNENILIDRDKSPLYDKDAFLGVRLNKTAESLLASKNLRTKPVIEERMNRAVLESTYPDAIKAHEWDRPLRKAADFTALIGNSNFALLLATVISLFTVARQRNLSREDTAKIVEVSLMSGGVIILITAAGGAFGAMLGKAAIGDAIQTVFGGLLADGNSPMILLTLSFVLALVLKIAQGSSTVAMIVGSGMMAAIINDKPELMTFHPAYLATSIGAGSLVGSWMNDSGFWIFAKMGGLTEAEALKSWTIMLAVLGVVSFGTTLLLAQMLPNGPFG